MAPSKNFTGLNLQGTSVPKNTLNHLYMVCIESYLKVMGYGAVVWDIFFCYSSQKIQEAVPGGCVLI